MQPQRNLDLAGIAPEAWERVRAAAAQDGLAVDEWLQRRLREQNTNPSNSRSANQAQKREAPISKNRIADAVEAMSRLLEANERSQQQARQAMTSLTSEITNASHEQASAFQELKERVDHLKKESEASEMREGFVDERLNAITERLRATDAVATRCVQIDNRIDMLAMRVDKMDDVESAVAKYGSQQAELSAKIETQAEQFETVAHAILAARENMKGLERSIQDQLRALAGRMEATESAMVTQPQFCAVQDDIKRFEGSVDEKFGDLRARLDADEAIMVTQPQFAAVQEDIKRRQQSVEENMSALTARVGSAEAAMATKLQFTTVQEDAKRFEQKTGEQLSALTSRVTAFEKLEKIVAELGSRHGDTKSQVQSVADNVQALGKDFLLACETTNALAERLHSVEERLGTTDTKIMLALGLAYSDGIGVERNDNEAVVWLERAAKGGEAVAQFRMAARYEHGIGVAIDTDQAIRLYTDAANQGHVKAMNNLGVFYLNDIAGGQNFEQALHWFQMAAERGLTDAQFNLGVMYERGLGVEASLAESYKWYAMAEAGGDFAATAHCDAIAEKLMAAQNAGEPAAVEA